MGFNERITDFEGIPVQDFDHENPPDSLGGIGWRISIDWDTYEAGVKFVEPFSQLLATPGANDLEALVVGCWEGSAEGTNSDGVVEAIVSAREKLPNLKHLFIGEILQEECEVSWITQSDVSPIFLAFPKLVTLRVRGMSNLSLGRPAHKNLRHLILEGGGMPAAIVNELVSADLPNLDHLELWLGDQGYGRDVTVGQLQPILDGQLFPKLQYLGLRNDCEIDTTVSWLQGAKILDQLKVLDISLGCLTDAGVETLVQNDKLKQLERLDAYHNFLTNSAIEKLASALPSVAVDVSLSNDADEYDGEVYRYNFVSE